MLRASCPSAFFFIARYQSGCQDPRPDASARCVRLREAAGGMHGHAQGQCREIAAQPRCHGIPQEVLSSPAPALRRRHRRPDVGAVPLPMPKTFEEYTRGRHVFFRAVHADSNAAFLVGGQQETGLPSRNATLPNGWAGGLVRNGRAHGAARMSRPARLDSQV
jgi:hypothetical protein